MEYKIKIYQLENGKRPFSEWIKSLSDERIRAAIRMRIGRLEVGNFGQCKSLGGGLYEVKIDKGPGYRIYFSKVGFEILLLLCGGDKGSQKKDITKAKVYLQDYKTEE